MTSTTSTPATPGAAGGARTVKVFRVFIEAPQAKVWQAIVDPAWNGRYGYGSPSEYELRPGGTFRTLATDEMKQFGGPDVIIDGEVLEVDEPNKLTLTWRTLWDEEAAAEGFTTLTYELKPIGATATRLTMIHDLTDAPRNDGLISGDIEPFGGGWPQILSDLKTLLETGTKMDFGAADANPQ